MFCVLREESILVGLNRGFDGWINFGKWLGIYLSAKNGKTLQVNNILFIRCTRNKITVCSGIPNNFTLLFIVRHWWLPFLMLCLLNSWQKCIFSCLFLLFFFWYSFYKQWFSQKGKSFPSLLLGLMQHSVHQIVSLSSWLHWTITFFRALAIKWVCLFMMKDSLVTGKAVSSKHNVCIPCIVSSLWTHRKTLPSIFALGDHVTSNVHITSNTPKPEIKNSCVIFYWLCSLMPESSVMQWPGL